MGIHETCEKAPPVGEKNPAGVPKPPAPGPNSRARGGDRMEQMGGGRSGFSTAEAGTILNYAEHNSRRIGNPCRTGAAECM